MKRVKPSQQPAAPSSRLIVKNLPKTLDEASLKKVFENFGPVTDCQIMFRGEVHRGFAFVGFRDPEAAETARAKLDRSFIGSSKIAVEFAVEKTPENPKLKKQPPTAPAPNAAPPAEIDEKRLYVTNLPYAVGDAELAGLFQKYGKVEAAKVIVRNGQSCGYGFVTFAEDNSAVRALHELDRKTVFGRPLGVSQCNKAAGKGVEPQAPAPSGKSDFQKLKKQKLLNRLHDDKHWNSSFLNPNTVMERMSDKLGVSRKALLDNEIENPAVLKALCEREILEEVAEFLRASGVDPQLFSAPKSETLRSNTTLLVKNLPFKAKAQKVEELFSQYGKVESFLMPPNRAVALVEFASAEHATNALNSLGDYVFQGVPLFLEWAPQGTRRAVASQAQPTTEPPAQETAQNPTVYIKNLSLETEEADIEHLLSESGLGDFKFVKVVQREGKSLGYGFVEFETPESAGKMIRKLQNHLLHSHALKLSESKPRPAEKREDREDEAHPPSDKIVLKNLPFQTNRQELTALVKGVAPAREVRLPKKADGSLKGFAFVQFASVEDAKKGMEALQNLHFYGRRLVPQFARE